MKNIEEFIKTSNLIFTDTITRGDICRVDYDYRKETPILDNSISVFNLMKSFNDEYLRFKKEYEDIGKIKLGTYNSITRVNEFKFDTDFYRVMEIYIEKPTICDKNYTFLNIREINGEMKPFITSGGNPYDDDAYQNPVDLSNIPAKEYLDLFIKYQEFIKKYKYFKNEQLFGDGTFCIFSWMDKYHANILEGLKEWNLSLGGSYFDGEDYLEFNAKFNDNFTIKDEDCKFVYDCKDEKEASYEDIAKRLYLNNNHTMKKHYN